MNNPLVNMDARMSDRVRRFYDLLAGRPLELQPEIGRAMPGVEQIGGLGQEISLVQVDCAETATMKAWDLGAEVLKDVTMIPDSGWYSVIRDPAGARVGLFQPIQKNGKKRASP